jgi:hypothetical protein
VKKAKERLVKREQRELSLKSSKESAVFNQKKRNMD